MSEIKPIDWDALPKVWAWNVDNEDTCQQGVFIGKVDGNFKVISECHVCLRFDKISETDPRIKEIRVSPVCDSYRTPKMRVMTAEELNDIYCDTMKNFRMKYANGSIVFHHNFLPKNDLSNCEYSTDRGKTWAKCEVAE